MPPFIRSILFGIVILFELTACGGGSDSNSDNVPSRRVPLFSKPYAGDFLVVNYFDHNTPREFTDSNGVFVIFTGESVPTTGFAAMYDGHEGYDFIMPEGTPLLAAADGVIFAVQDSTPPFFCPPLNATITQNKLVGIRHELPDGRSVLSYYFHMSRMDVVVGEQVVAGQQIGLSGNSGCSTGPHLHFETYLAVDNLWVTIDPFGWEGSIPDPWEAFAGGAASIALWKPGEEPLLSRGYDFDLASVAPFAPAFLTRVVYQGPRDDLKPNNEYLELSIDTRLASSVDTTGYAISFERAGFSYVLPAGVTLDALNPTIRIYIGSGMANANTLYIGRSDPLISNLGDDCLRVLYPGGGSARFSLGSCP
jgi:murein DD-endopeptidase MepM/ murein hydrolase activator NlpD